MRGEAHPGPRVGLGGLYVGPFDLSLDLGLVEDGSITNPELLEACDAVLQAADRHGLIAGIFTGSAEAGRRMAGRGFRFVNIATSTGLLKVAAQAELARARGRG